MNSQSQTRKGLYKTLKEYSQSDYYGFHMPGHKRILGEFMNPFSMDITEIEGFDDLHHPQEQGILVQAQERAARIYGSAETHFLVNGSTAGILTAISACTKRNGKILAARNCHRSVYHGIALQNLAAVYVYPQQETVLGINGSILPEDVENAFMEHGDIQAVILTSPTYDGICSDIRSICRMAHRRGIPVIVDQAHGAHFSFHRAYPEDAVCQGADVVIHSVHKTLPSLTQTALLHVNGNLVDRERLNMFLSVYQTSSPSYVLMASIDSCMDFLESQGTEAFDRQVDLLKCFYQECRGLKHLQLMDEKMRDGHVIWDLDLSKLLFSVKNTHWTGGQLGELLWRDFHIQMEMNTCTYSLGISSVADTKEGFERLKQALYFADEKIEQESKDTLGTMEDFRREETLNRNNPPDFYAEMTIGDAMDMEKESVLRWNSMGRTAGSFVYLYPPGIPLLVPGERITKEAVAQMEVWEKHQMEIHGLEEDGSIQVLKG